MVKLRGRCKLIIDIMVRTYIAITLSLMLFYAYQKYIVTYDDIIVEIPATFLKDEYINTDVVDNYSLLATTVNNQTIIATTGITCKIDNLWERMETIGPNAYPFMFDEERLSDVREIQEELEGHEFDSAEAVDIIRKWGDKISSAGGWAFAFTFDISELNLPEPTECRLKIYRETKTPFFNISKVKTYVTNSIIVQRTVSD